MLEVRVRFWTNKIADEQGKVLPRHAWSAGVVRLASNAAHGIKGSRPVPFNSLMELNSAIEKLLVREKVTLLVGKRMKRYMESP